ncbi:MAG: TetR/AcrR family transcriptional regulator [Jatrophihabitans sp.]|uniref:TetR/AcrR family transcriptional regulator n=1 Tax=Jatrophihabitans sp. TaxID=1932789 RepID=UPI00390F3071
MTTVEQRRSQRRDQILSAAWEIAAEVGLGAVSLHEVARRVGVKQPPLYGYVSGGENQTVDAVEFARILSGRADGPGVLQHKLPL